MSEQFLPPIPSSVSSRSLARVWAWLRSVAGGVDWYACLAFGLPFALYVRTLAPTIYNLDSAEFTTAAATGGLIRATGYPLYLLLGRIWVHVLPFGDFGYRLNLFSAFCGALTIVLAERILRRWQVGPIARFGTLGILAASPYFWGLSLIAEVYTLQTALMAGLLLLLLRWADQPTTGRLCLVGFLGGLSLGHHAATVLLIPGFVVFAALVAGRSLWHPSVLLPVLGTGILGFAIYLYLPILFLSRPVFNYAGSYDATGTFQALNLLDPGDFLALITARSFLGNAEPGGTGLSITQNARTFIQLLVQAFFAIGIGPAMLGAAVLWRRNRRVGLLLALVFFCHAVFFMNYKVVDNDTMHLPAYLIWALWLGVGYQWLLQWLGSSRTNHPQAIFSGTILAAVLAAMLWNWPLVDRSHDTSARVRGETLARQLLPDAMVFGTWQTVPVLEYLQLVENQRPDVTAINRFLIKSEAMYLLIANTAAERPVYLDSVPPDLPSIFYVRPAGLLFRVQLREEVPVNPMPPCPLPIDQAMVVDCVDKEP